MPVPTQLVDARERDDLTRLVTSEPRDAGQAHAATGLTAPRGSDMTPIGREGQG